MDTQETHGNLRFELSEDKQGRPLCQAWRGKQRDSYAYLRFRSAKRCAEWIHEQKNSEDKRVEFKAELAAEKKRRTAETKAALQVGALLVNSWGYDQTNVDFYEVVERKPASVVLRKIAGDLTETGHMSGQTTPRPGQFIGAPFLKRITPYGVSFDHGGCGITEPGSTHYASWYA